MRNKKRNIGRRTIILLVLCFITLGFALLSTTLFINGSASVKANTWNIHWDKDSVKETTGSVTASTPAVADADELVISFAAEFELPGDYYEFTVDAVNEGTIDGIIADTLDIKKGIYAVDDLEEETPVEAKNFKYTVVYADDDNDSTNDVAPAVGDILKAGESQKYKVRVEFDSKIEELPETSESYKFKFEVTYSQHKEPSRSQLSWSEVAEEYKNNQTESLTEEMEDGVTRTVDLGEIGKYELRIVNVSTPTECSNSNFSETGCGLVLEFAEIPFLKRMNPYDYNDSTSGKTNGTGNKGGWEYSELRAYLNGEFLNSLPEELQNLIIDTRVVSGHGSNDTTNFTTTDKIFILSTTEIYGPATNSYAKDTAQSYQRHLDFYDILGVSHPEGGGNYGPEIKKYNGTATSYWSRTPTEYFGFFTPLASGSASGLPTNHSTGVVPAFRIALDTND